MFEERCLSSVYCSLDVFFVMKLVLKSLFVFFVMKLIRVASR